MPSVYKAGLLSRLRTTGIQTTASLISYFLFLLTFNFIFNIGVLRHAGNVFASSESDVGAQGADAGHEFCCGSCSEPSKAQTGNAKVELRHPKNADKRLPEIVWSWLSDRSTTYKCKSSLFQCICLRLLAVRMTILTHVTRLQTWAQDYHLFCREAYTNRDASSACLMSKLKSRYPTISGIIFAQFLAYEVRYVHCSLSINYLVDEILPLRSSLFGKTDI